MRKPNYKRKYKKRFYLLLGVGVIGTLLVLVNPLINKIVDDREISMVEGVDFSQEVMVIDNKEVVKDVNISLYDLFSPYTNGRVDKYYHLYSNDVDIMTDQVTYDGIVVGEQVNIYISKDNSYFTSSSMAKRDSLGKKFELISIFSIIIPSISILLLIYLFVLRKSLINPYYQGQITQHK